MLRTAVVIVAILLLALGVWLAALIGAQAGIAAIVIGAILLLSVTFERYRYKRIEDHVPDPGWQPTGERYREPGSNDLIAVYFNPRTGKRKYVRLRQAPSEPS